MRSNSSELRKHILITGASGGLGSAIAELYASANTHLSLLGRDLSRLESIKNICELKGASVTLLQCDLRNIELSSELILHLDSKDSIDIAFMNAGVSSGILPDGSMETTADVYRLMHLNASSSITLASALLHQMQLRGKGQLVFISSLAAYFPLASSPAYSASKAAILSYARAMNDFFKRSGPRVSVVCAGYIETPMSLRLKGSKPFCCSAQKAAKIIQSQLNKGKDEISFPFLLSFGIRLLQFLPAFLSSFFAGLFKFTVEPDLESLAATKLGHNSAQKTTSTDTKKDQYPENIKLQ